jgi:para-aminobenzoate synthetase/4-amino-4-deoxychorismate lyase
VVDRAAAQVEYGVGAGIVWDSNPGDEYRECVTKAKILSHPAPEFDLLETLLWRPGEGFVLLERHLDRLEAAAEYFGRPFDRREILGRLEQVPGQELRSRARHRAEVRDQPRNSVISDPVTAAPLRVRILVDAGGTIRVESVPIAATADPAPVRLGLAADPVDRENPFLHFKTTYRGVYDRARASRPDCEDVLLWNERGEVTESTIANLVVGIDGELVTPPVACGLLAGTFRAELLDRGEIAERVVRVDDLSRAESLHLVNSVQGWRNVEWVD